MLNSAFGYFIFKIKVKTMINAGGVWCVAYAVLTVFNSILAVLKKKPLQECRGFEGCSNNKDDNYA